MLADLFDAYLLDLDGVVCLGDEPLPHAKESLERLREKGKALRFLTNDPRPTRDEVARRLSGMGVQARADEVVTSGWATAGYLTEAGLHSAHVVGSPGLASAASREVLGKECSGTYELTERSHQVFHQCP